MGEARIVRYTAEELAEKRRREGTLTDWAHVHALTDEEIEASIDFEEEGYPDWSIIYANGHDRRVPTEIDADLLRWFQRQGDDYLDQISLVLRKHMSATVRERVEAEIAAEHAAAQGVSPNS
jgi:uncharacterized protein (DUF4415 family)